MPSRGANLAAVAQSVEHRIEDPGRGGSTPSGSTILGGSSAAERLTVNQVVVGSIPTSPANQTSPRAWSGRVIDRPIRKGGAGRGTGTVLPVGSKARNACEPTGGPFGAIAQMGERLLCKQRVVGSIPTGSTNHQEPRKATGLAGSCEYRPSGRSPPHGAETIHRGNTVESGVASLAPLRGRSMHCHSPGHRHGGDSGDAMVGSSGLTHRSLRASGNEGPRGKRVVPSHRHTSSLAAREQGKAPGSRFAAKSGRQFDGERGLDGLRCPVKPPSTLAVVSRSPRASFVIRDD